MNTFSFKVPDNLIVIDFDLKDADRKLPETCAELSKSGQGIHLQYYFNGDVRTL